MISVHAPRYKSWDEIAFELKRISGCESVAVNPSYSTHGQSKHFVHFDGECHMVDTIGDMYAHARYLADKRDETKTVVPVVFEREMGVSGE